MTVDSKPRDVISDGPEERNPRDAAGLLLARLTALPALLILPLLLVGFPFLLAGFFQPVPVLVLWLALAVAVVPYVWRRIPSVTGAGALGTTAHSLAKPTPRWTLWVLVAVSVAFGAFNTLYHSQFVIVEYDGASYFQFANWIAGHGTTVIGENASAFGGSHPADITFASAAFFQQGGHLVPQFMSGLPILLSTGFWAGGSRLAVFWAPLLGALAVFTFGGLAARLVGPRWAPFAALALAVTVPMQYTARATWSEPLALIFLIGGMSLWIDSQHADRGPEDAGVWRANWRRHLRSESHVLAGAAGLLLGMTFLVRIDGPADIMLVIPYCGLLLLRRYRQVFPLMAGLAVGMVYGAVDAGLLTLPYVQVNHTPVEGMVAGIVVLLLGTAIALRWLRRRGSELSGPPRPRLVKAVAILPFFVALVFLIRPYVERGGTTDAHARLLSLHWIYWYTGIAAILFALAGYALVGRRAVRREAPTWVLPLLVFGFATTSFLFMVSINPHQPYGSRRLVAAVLPGVIIMATAAASWLAQRSRVIHLVNVPVFLQRSPRAAVIAVCAAAIALPALYGNVNGLAFKRTFTGEVGMVNQLCAQIPKNVSVLMIDNNNIDLKFAQTIRGTCGVPVAGTQTTVPATGSQPAVGDITEPNVILAAIADIKSSGHTPFVLAYSEAELAPVTSRFGNGTVKLMLNQQTPDDEHIYLGEPKNTVAERFTIYSWEPSK